MTPLLLCSILGAANERFLAGLAALPDSQAAQLQFAAAARTYDEAWHAGAKEPVVAQNRGRAHCLAGDKARAVAAFHDGLALAPWHTGLHADLQQLRVSIIPPDDRELWPPSSSFIRQRVSPLDRLLIACVASLMVTAGIIAHICFGSRYAAKILLLAGGTGVLLVIGCAGESWREEQQEKATPIVVIATPDLILRTGNAAFYPPRRERPLPVGLEARCLARRGGWIRVRIGETLIGWLPADAVIILDHSPRFSSKSANRSAAGSPGFATTSGGYVVGSTGL